jgi:hypothetical protein
MLFLGCLVVIVTVLPLLVCILIWQVSTCHYTTYFVVYYVLGPIFLDVPRLNMGVFLALSKDDKGVKKVF